MNIVKGLAGLAATTVIAAVVAYSVSAPRNLDHAMNQDMAALEGLSINEHVAEVRADVASQQCETYQRLADEAWDKAVEHGTEERDAASIDELESQVARYCNRGGSM